MISEKTTSHNHTLDLLHQMIGADMNFRPGQWEAIEAIAIKKQRALVVQRTGWGKSLVYFLATKLLREEGAGPTLLISPLLSLMRNQIEMAGKIGIRAFTINSENREEWTKVEEALANDECDLMLISPERLNNEHFLQQVLPQISGRIGLFVVDEAHSISDWGHDFRPDYRRIVRIVQMLPQGVPVLGITATANNRVVADVLSQLGPGLVILRGSLSMERFTSLGIYALTRADAEYPARYRQRLKESAPTVLFYSGEKALLGQPGIAVVGSRHLDEAGQSCAELVGNACGLSGLVLYSGGAKGVDTISMNAALTARGTAVGILADSLEKAIRDPENRAAISRSDLCLVTPYSPSAPFSVGTAMGRNKLIYTLADYAIIVASDAEKGGTWAGATEALRATWTPVFVLEYPGMPEGNTMLLQKGAIGFPHPFHGDRRKLRDWLEDQSSQVKPEPHQPGLF